MGRHANFRRVTALCAAAILAAGCSGDVSPEDRRSEETRRPAESAEPARTARGCRVPRRADPPAAVPHYDMSLEVDVEEGVVAGTSHVTFVADRATQRLVFRLWPNGPRLAAEGTSLVVDEASMVEGRASVETPDPTTLVFELDERLPPGEIVIAELRWRLELPGAILDRISQNGESIRLGSFFPILSWEGERGWATDPPTTTLAESSTSPTADFEVLIEAPSDLEVIATGEQRSAGRWVARNVRDFAIALGRFDVVRTTVDAPRPVDVTVGVAEGLDASPKEFSAAIDAALRDLARRYGAYPWPTYSVAVMPDLGRSAIEYPTMIFHGEGSLDNATTHEVAHSWFYGLVGNNQARDPWLDEGVTSWAQARGDGILGFFRDYEIPESVKGRVGEPMRYWDANEDDYYAGVYVQGAKALDALGRARRVDCALKRYVAENAYGVATTEDLVAALEPAFPRARRVLTRFGARR